MLTNQAYLYPAQPVASIVKGNFPMGISKIGPKKFFIKARVKVRGLDPRLPVEDRRKQEVFFGTASEAEERYLAIKADLRGERQEARTFGDFLETYRDSRGGEIPRSELSIYEELERDLGPVELENLEGALQQYAGLLRRLPSKTTGKPLSNASMNRRRAMVAATLNLAVELKRLKASPLHKAIWPKLKEIPRDRYLDPAESNRLMEIVAEHAPHLYFIFWFAIQVPCRKSELITMARPDLDLINEAIRVHNGTTKNGEGIWKPIPPNMVTYFRSLPADCPYLFYRKEGETYLPLGDFKTAWKRCLKLAGITDFRFHDTRHIAATEMVNAGTPERVVMAIAGWETNMLSTYWKSLGKKNLGLVRFPTGRGNQGATSEESRGESGDFGMERAVS